MKEKKKSIDLDHIPKTVTVVNKRERKIKNIIERVEVIAAVVRVIINKKDKMIKENGAEAILKKKTNPEGFKLVTQELK